MKHLTIQTKLVAVTLVMACLFVGIGYMAYSSIQSLQADFDEHMVEMEQPGQGVESDAGSQTAAVQAAGSDLRQQDFAGLCDAAMRKLMIGCTAGVIFLLVINGLLIRHVKVSVRQLRILADKVDQGDLTFRAEVKSRDEIGEVTRAMNHTIDSLESMIAQTARLADLLSQETTEVSESNQSLSEGSTEQAASLEEIASSMTELASQTQVNAENASHANHLAVSAREAAGTGVQSMEEMNVAMGEITSSSNQIAKIINVIDDIAFQTNLLALNAAVEAARAGVHGRGFAVVAEEVRNLAAQSAEAAKETAEIIATSSRQVHRGEEIAKQTALALNDIVEQVTKTTDLISEISAASSEQAQGVGQVNVGLEQIDKVTSHIAMIAEKTAHTGMAMSDRAQELRKLVQQFDFSQSSGPSTDFDTSGVAKFGQNSNVKGVKSSPFRSSATEILPARQKIQSSSRAATGNSHDEQKTNREGPSGAQSGRSSGSQFGSSLGIRSKDASAGSRNKQQVPVNGAVHERGQKCPASSSDGSSGKHEVWGTQLEELPPETICLDGDDFGKY